MLDISFSTCFLSRHLDWFTQSQTVFFCFSLSLHHTDKHMYAHISHTFWQLTLCTWMSRRVSEGLRQLCASVCVCLCLCVCCLNIVNSSGFFFFFLLLRILANQSGSLRENWGNRECKRELQESEAVEILYIGHKAEALTWEDAVWENFRKWWTLVIF